MDLFKKASLIITTCPRRDHFVTRILDYYQSVAPQLSIVLVGEESQDLSLFTHRPRQNITSILAPEHTNLYQKVSVVLRHVSSELIAICADDDFLEFTALENAFNHLMSDPNAVAVRGSSVSFCHICGTLWVKPKHDRPIVGRHAVSRVLQQSASGGQLIYIAVRREAAVRSYQAATAEIKYSRYCEQILSHVLPLDGNIIYLDQPFNIRQWDIASEGNSIARFSTYYFNQKHDAETKQFKKIILGCMKDHEMLVGADSTEYDAFFANVIDQLLCYRFGHSNMSEQKNRSSVMRLARGYLNRMTINQRRNFERSVKNHFTPIESTPFSTIPVFSYLQKAL